MLYTHLDTPIGRLTLVGDGESLTELRLPKRPGSVGGLDEDRDAFAEPIDQLERYFTGELKEFDLKLDPRGGAFDREVWDQLARIPYGQTMSYGEVAAAIGHPDAFRAVGSANGRNPIAIVVPCHRVIGSDGKLVGFGGGLDAKRALLDLEQGGIQERLL